MFCIVCDHSAAPFVDTKLNITEKWETEKSAINILLHILPIWKGVTGPVADTGGLGPGPPCPHDFFKIMQFWRNFRGKPLFWQIAGSGPPLGAKLCWPPWPKSWIRPCTPLVRLCHSDWNETFVVVRALFKQKPQVQESITNTVAEAKGFLCGKISLLGPFARLKQGAKTTVQQTCTIRNN